MSWVFIIAFCFLVFLCLAVPGLWISVALGVTGILGMLLTPYSASQVIANCVWHLCTNFALSAVPLFILMGEVILLSGLSKMLYKSVAKYLRGIPGGMLHSNIVACAIFAAICGASPPTAAAIGGVAIPEMERVGYKGKYVYGSIAAGGTLGILIPPSLTLIVYGAMVGESVIRLFTAAIIPGIMLAIIFMIYIAILAVVKKEDFKDVDFGVYEDISHFKAIMGFLPIAILIFIVLGSMFLGFATPTEAASIGAFGAIVIGFTVGNLTMEKLWHAFGKAAKTTAMILFIILGAGIFSYVMSSTNATLALTRWMVEIEMSKTVLLVCVYALYIFLGMFVDGVSSLYLTLPVLYPVLMAYGIDSIWFGVVLVVLIEMGMITPPMGLNVFVIKGIVPQAKLTTVFRGAFPYVLLMLGFIVLLTVLPGITSIIKL